MKPRLQISIPELVVLLSVVDKPTFTHLVTETKVRMNKTGNPYYDQVIKRSSCNYYIGSDYESRVNNNREKEDKERTFETEQSSVGTHVSKCVLFNENKQTYYLQVEIFDEIKPQVENIYNGNPIEKQLFESYLVKKSESIKQGLDRKVNVITYKMDSIKEISLNGNIYEIV